MTSDSLTASGAAAAPPTQDGRPPVPDATGTAKPSEEGATDSSPFRGVPSWVTNSLKAGADLKVTGFSAVCHSLLVALLLASKSGVASHAGVVLKFCALALAVPATAAALLLGVEMVWPKGVDTYTSLIRAGFSIRKSADEAITDDHRTLDYYQLLNVGLNTKTVQARRQYQVLLAPRQRAAIAFDLGLPEYLSAEGCPTNHSGSATLVITFGDDKLRELTFGSQAPPVMFDREWWDQNEAKLHARGYPKTGGHYALPLVVSLASNTAVQVSKDAAPCVTFNPLIAIEVYKQRYPKAGV